MVICFTCPQNPIWRQLALDSLVELSDDDVDEDDYDDDDDDADYDDAADDDNDDFSLRLLQQNNILFFILNKIPG